MKALQVLRNPDNPRGRKYLLWVESPRIIPEESMMLVQNEYQPESWQLIVQGYSLERVKRMAKDVAVGLDAVVAEIWTWGAIGKLVFSYKWRGSEVSA